MMPKKKIKEAIEEAHELADKAIDEAQEELEEAKQGVMAWLKTECTFKRSELIIICGCVILAFATLILL
jgi:vacuolar-type H+-ATPase subunit H